MHDSEALRRQGHRLIQLGMLLFLLALVVGLLVPRFAIPRLGLSTHLLGIMQGLFLMVVGLLWPRLQLGRTMGRVGVILAVYGCGAAWTGNLLGAIWGAGGSMVPLAAGGLQGTALQEGIIALAMRSAALALLAVAMLILWGLRRRPR